MGLVFFGLTVGGCAAATSVVASRRLAHLRGSPRFLAWGVLFTVALTSVHLVPGVLGILSRGTVLAATALVVLAALFVPPEPETARDVPLAGPASPRYSWAFAAVGGMAVTVVSLAYIRLFATYPVLHGDVLTFHLPVVAVWLQEGSLWPIAQFEPDLANGNYPQTGNLISLAAILPWHDDAFSRFVFVPWVAGLGVAVYAMARELRSPRAVAALAGVALCGTWIVVLPGVEVALPDSVLLACFGAGMVFLVRHFRTARRSDLWVAGLALGVAFGVKWYGLTAVAAVLLVWAAAGLVARRGVGWVVRNGAILVGLVLAVGGFWLVRNWVQSGSPLFPRGLQALGVTIFKEPPDAIRAEFDHQVLEYIFSPKVWADYMAPQYFHSWGVTLPLLAVGVVLGVVMLLRRGRREGPAPRGLIVATIAVIVLLTLAYLKTPYSALGPEGAPRLIGNNSRYLVPAALPAAALLAWAIGQLGRRWRIPLELGLLACVVVGLARAFEIRILAPTALVLAVLLAGGAFAFFRYRDRIHVKGHRGVLAAGAVVGVAIAVVVGFEVQNRYRDHRLVGLDETFTWMNARPEPRKIGIVGYDSLERTSPVYPMFGPELRNEVKYVGPFVDGMLRRYTDRASFTRALKRDRYQLLLVGSSELKRDRGLEPLAWARRAGWKPVARSPSLTLLKAPGASAAAR